MDLAPAAPAFDLGGGAPCLDLANTVSGRGRGAPVDRLAGYPDLIAWGVQGGLVDGETAAGLGRAAARRPAAAAAALGRARALREALFRLFAAAAAGRRPAPGDLAALNRALTAALPRLRLEDGGGAPYRWRWQGDGAAEPALDRVLWPVARSAAELLTSGDLAAVRECAAPDCRWLFLDRSRNRSRRWCAMATCGNRSKARRHYRRGRAGG